MFIHDILNIFKVTNKGEKDALVDILAIAIYGDQLVRQEELDAAYVAMTKFFDGEDVEYMTSRLKNTLDDFGNDITKFETKKGQVLQYIMQEDRKDIAQLIKKILYADHEISKGEQQMLQRLYKLL